MAAMVDHTPAYTRVAIDSMAPEDFETASIRSAAPSYTSDAPSYHSTAPHPDPLPPYSPPASRSALGNNNNNTNNSSVSSLLGPDPYPASHRRQGGGLPPVPSGPVRQPEPSLNQFRIPSWPTSTSNPTARIYHNVALRRASAASSSSSAAAQASLQDGLRRVMLERIEEEERNRVRPLEDPYLVGEEAAARARRERLARENCGHGHEILVREDRRWDFFLAQMKDREERDKSWRRFRRDMDRRSSSRLPFRIGARF